MICLQILTKTANVNTGNLSIKCECIVPASASASRKQCWSFVLYATDNTKTELRGVSHQVL